MHTRELNLTEEPLTRSDVEKLLDIAGSSDKLDLSGRNLSQIDLSEFNLTGATFIGANLTKANLTKAKLIGATLLQANLVNADLSEAEIKYANLQRANLSEAILKGANLSEAKLFGANLNKTNLSRAIMTKIYLQEATLDDADLSGADLTNANLILAKLGGVNLTGATLTGATLYQAYLKRTNLSGVNLSGASLSGALLSQANLSRANLSDTNFSEAILIEVALHGALFSRTTNFNKATLIDVHLSKDQLSSLGVESLDELEASGDVRNLTTEQDSSSTIHLRTRKEPLTAQDLTSIMSALTDLYTKCWLIRQGRLSDLIEYTQTHDPRFSTEANLVITELSHNSPLTIKLDVGIKEIVEAFKLAFEAITQAPLKCEKLKLDIARKKQKVEKERLEVQEKQLELEKKRIEFALEEASKIVDVLRPNADATEKAIFAQALLPNLLQLAQLGEGKGLELILPAPKSTEERVVVVEGEVINVVEDK